MQTKLFDLHRENEKTGNSNSTVQKSMLHTGDPGYSEGLSLNRNFLDNQRPDPMHTNPAHQPGGHLLSSNEINVSIFIEVVVFQ